MLTIKQMGSCLLLLSATVISNAMPNEWNLAISQGIDQYSIYNNKHQILYVSCSERFGFGVFFLPDYNQNKLISYDEQGTSLSFVFDEKTNMTLPKNIEKPTVDFIQNIAHAQKIELFNNNKKVATFAPAIHSIEKYSSMMIDSCLN